MIFSPSAKALVYRELQFIATSVPAPARITPIPQIFDEVAQDIRALFLELPEVLEAPMRMQQTQHS